MTQIFRTFAPNYFEQDYNVIPLRKNEKRPILNEWTQYCDKPVSVALRNDWLERFPEANIGFPAGPANNIVFIDVDTDNEKVFEIVERVCGKSPYHRFGRKGYAAAYLWGPQQPQKPFQLLDSNGKVLVEFLTSGRQLVIAPSIHPETKRAYVENMPLWEVLRGGQLSVLRPDIREALTTELEVAGIKVKRGGGVGIMTDFVPTGQRDSKMTSFAGLCATDVCRGTLTLMQAVSRMETWGAELVARVGSDDLDIQKGVAKILEFLEKDVCQAGGKPLPLGWDEGLEGEFKSRVESIFTKDHVEWSYDQIKQYLKESFAKGMVKGDPNADKRKVEDIKYAVEKITRSSGLQEIDIEMLLKYISDASGIKGMSVPNLKKLLVEFKRSKIQGNDHTSVAREIIKWLEQFGELRYHGGGIQRWNGSHWEVLGDDFVKGELAREFGHLSACRKEGDHNGILKVMKRLVPEGLVVGAGGVNFANGYLTIDGSLEDHSKSFGCTYTLGYRYLDLFGRGGGTLEEHAPMFWGVLKNSWGADADFNQKLESLREAICATMFGLTTKFQRCFLLYGKGGSGKSTILEVVRGLFDKDSMSALAPESWKEDKYKAELYGKLINICGELSEDEFIKGDAFKAVVDGSLICGRRMWGDPFYFQPICGHWFAANHLPLSRDTSDGFIRRWLILSFDTKVPEGSKILNLGSKIVEKEREVIASWAASGVDKLRGREDYTVPPSHGRRVDQMAENNDSVRYFMSHEKDIKVGQGSVNATELYTTYRVFCQSSGTKYAVGFRTFCRRLEDLAGEIGFTAVVSGIDMTLEGLHIHAS